MGEKNSERYIVEEKQYLYNFLGDKMDGDGFECC